MKSRVTKIVFAGFLAVFTGSAGATLIDLTSPGSATVNGAIFTVPTQFTGPTGSGTWDPFVRIHNTTDKSGTDCSPASNKGKTCEQGYNTSDHNFQFDEIDGPFTRDLLFSQTTIVHYGPGAGADYLEFILDIAEPAADNDNQSKALLSLDQLQLFVGAKQTNSYTPDTGDGTLGSLIALFSLDAGGDNALILNYDLVGSGNGRADMTVLIPLSVVPVALQVPGSYVYLFSRFGDQQGPPAAIAEGSYEEWARIASSGGATCPPGSTDPQCNHPQPDVIPEPQSLALVGLAMLMLAVMRRRRST